LTNVDLRGVIEDHRRSGALVTMALVPNTEPDKYGGVLVDEGGAVTGFTPKRSAQPSFHFIGVQVADAEAFASLADDRPHESVGALYPDWMRKRPGAIRAHVSNAEFFDIGTPADYLHTCATLAAREGRPLTGGSVLWDDVVVEPGATVRGSVVTDGVHLPAGDWINMTIRRAEGDLEPFEERRNNLAVAPLAR